MSVKNEKIASRIETWPIFLLYVLIYVCLPRRRVDEGLPLFGVSEGRDPEWLV